MTRHDTNFGLSAKDMESIGTALRQSEWLLSNSSGGTVTQATKVGAAPPRLSGSLRRIEELLGSVA